MSRLFQITHEDIEQLNDSQLTDLLRRLLHLEAARSGIAARSVSVALNIDVPDGGEDGRIQWKKGPKNTDYIPSRLPMFQNKARDMGPKACADEMHQEHSVRLKPRIEEVLDSGGSYVLFATQSLNGRQIADRLKAMREAIRDAGKSYASQADLRIYDANLIRDWTNHYIPAISLGGAEFQGSGPALQDWQPRIPKDLQKVFNYFDEVLGRLTTVALGSGEVAEQSRNAIAGHIRGLVRYGRIDALDPPITAIVDNQGSYWPKALEQVRQTIRYDGSNIPQTALQQLYRWEELLQPRSIPERLRIIVSTPPWRDIERDKNTRFLNRGEERAQALAEECARDPRPWMEHLPVLLQGEQRQGLAFGRRLGQCIDEPEPFISEALRVLASLNRGNGNPLVLAAFFGSIKENHQELVERTLDIVAHEQSLSPYLVELTRLLKPELPDLHRVLRLVQTKRIPVSDLKMFSYGSVLNHLTSTDFINFIDALLTYGGPGVWVALDILMLHRHDRRADWTTWKPQFRKILMHPELSFVDPTTLTDFSSWQDVAAKLLEEGDTELARNISR